MRRTWHVRFAESTMQKTILLMVLNVSIAQCGAPRLICTIRGQEENERLGMAIAAAGDVNGDGYADLLVGDNRYGYYPDQRRCSLFLGKPVLDTLPDIVITQPDQMGDYHFGGTVDGGRDVNGDGFDDIVATGPSWGSGTGKVDLYYGGTLMDSLPDVTIKALESSWLTSFWSTWLRGRVVGDMNGDGYDEFVCLVGGLSLDAGAYVYFGGAPPDSVHDLGLQGPGPPGLDLGSDLADGDLNDDGYTDVVVGAYGPDAAWVYMGGPSPDTIPDVRLCPSGGANVEHLVCVPGDLNGDGYDDVVVSQPCEVEEGIPYARGFVFFGGARMDSVVDLEIRGNIQLGYAFRLSGGDINHDGYADLLVVDQTYTNAGSLAIYFGGVDMDTIPDFEMTVPATLRDTVVFLGDMTGDGWPEFAVSNPSGAGEIYIYTMGEVQAGETPVMPRMGGLRIVPNPSRGPTMIGFDVGGKSGATIGVYDLGGRLMQMLGPANQWDDACRLLWDGTNSLGQAVPAGTYVIRIQTQDRIMSGNVVVNR